MKRVQGIYAEALIFTNDIEDYALAQIQQLCDQEAFQNCKIRIMPDVHPGKVGPIGFTSTLGSKIMPNIVGSDIGCGITMAKLKQKKVEFQKLDRVIRKNIPDGSRIRRKPHRFAEQLRLEELKCSRSINMEIVQEYAAYNRKTILDELVKGMKWKVIEEYSSVHNYVDPKDRILRKGAVSAHKGETVLIPINMRDGLLIGKGIGNREWNYSAPHGSGRILRRDQVKEHYTVSAYKKEMKGIYSSCISKETLEEGPFAYRGIQEILEAVTDTVAVQQILKPIYNYKSQE